MSQLGNIIEYGRYLRLQISQVVDISDGIVENVRLEPMVLVQPSQCYMQILSFEYFIDFQQYDFDF